MSNSTTAHATASATLSANLTATPFLQAPNVSLSVPVSSVLSAPSPTPTPSSPPPSILGGLGFSGNGNGSSVQDAITNSAKNPSSLTTQLLICSVTGLLCFLAFCYLRTRLVVIFAPRMNMKRNRPPALPDSFLGWIIPLVRIKKEELLEKVGLDAVVLLQFVVMAIKLFGILSFFGIIILVPISSTNGNFSDPKTSAIDRLAITVVEKQPYLIPYLVFTYVFTLAAFYFLSQNYHEFVYVRARYLLRLSKTMTCRSVMITGIPQRLRSDQSLAEYYEGLGLGAVESAHVVRHFKDLNTLITKRASALKNLERAYTKYWGNPCKSKGYDPDRILEDAQLFKQIETETAKEAEQNHSALRTRLLGERFVGRSSQRPQVRTGFLGLFGAKVDAIDHYTELFGQLDKQVLEARKSHDYELTNVGFVTFEQPTSALIASQIAIHPEPFQCRTTLAYEPRDLIWKNMTIKGRSRVVRECLVWAITFFLVFFSIGPIAFFASLTSIDSLIKVIPGISHWISESHFLQNTLPGLIPTIFVNIFMAVLPYIFDAFGMLQGLRARSAIAEATFSKYFFFLFFNVLIIFTTTHAILQAFETYLYNPTRLVDDLATSLPTVAPFFINYTILYGFLLMPLSLLLLGSLILRGFWHVFLCKTPRDHAENRAPWDFNYGSEYPIVLLLFVIVLVYSTISPLILPFGTLYFCITYVVYKYQLLYVYFRPYETGGRLWTMAFPRVIVGMLVFQLTMTGLFILKGSVVLGVLCIPLMVATVVFKLTIDAAYRTNSLNLPMQLLKDDMLQLPTHQPAAITAETTMSAKSTAVQVPKARWRAAAAKALHRLERAESSTGLGQLPAHASESQAHHRRVVLDEDDYEAVPDSKTDYQQPPMLLNPGVLDTGLKRFGNPALVGMLPQLWLPVKQRLPGEEQPRPDKKQHKAAVSGRQEHGGTMVDELAKLLRRAESARRRVNSSIIQPVFVKKHKEESEHEAQELVKHSNSSPSVFQRWFGRASSHSLPAVNPARLATLDEEDFQDRHREDTCSPSASSHANLIKDHDSRSEDNGDEEDEDEDNPTPGPHHTYYHHPERRYSSITLDLVAGRQRPSMGASAGDRNSVQ